MTRPTRPVGTICPYPADVSDTCLSSQFDVDEHVASAILGSGIR
jgi:hypothetical protein